MITVINTVRLYKKKFSLLCCFSYCSLLIWLKKFHLLVMRKKIVFIFSEQKEDEGRWAGEGGWWNGKHKKRKTFSRIFFCLSAITLLFCLFYFFFFDCFQFWPSVSFSFFFLATTATPVWLLNKALVVGFMQKKKMTKKRRWNNIWKIK